MAAIVAADTTATIRERIVLPLKTAGMPMIMVTVDCLCDPGTTDTYPTGGLVLSPLFTTGNASDTWLDVNYPITSLGAITARISDAETPACPARFNNGGATAATQTLVLYVMVKDDGTKSDTWIEYPAEDVTTNTTVTTPIANGDKDIRWTMTLIGRLRPDVTTTGFVI